MELLKWAQLDPMVQTLFIWSYTFFYLKIISEGGEKKPLNFLLCYSASVRLPAVHCLLTQGLAPKRIENV